MLLQVSIELRLLRFGLLDAALDLWDLSVARAGLAVAHVLLEESLISLTLRLHLSLHVLQHVDHAADRVRPDRLGLLDGNASSASDGRSHEDGTRQRHSFVRVR